MLENLCPVGQICPSLSRARPFSNSPRSKGAARVAKKGRPMRCSISSKKAALKSQPSIYRTPTLIKCKKLSPNGAKRRRPRRGNNRQRKSCVQPIMLPRHHRRPQDTSERRFPKAKFQRLNKRVARPPRLPGEQAKRPVTLSPPSKLSM